MFVSAIHKLSSDIFTIRWLPRIAEAGVVLMMAWVVAGWLMGGTQAPVPSTGMGQRAGAAAVPSAEGIAVMPLFGDMAKEVAAAKPAPSVAAVPPVRLRLLGTMLAGAHSAAIIAPGSGNQKLVFVGDAIQPGVLLKGVETAAIEVDNHGGPERILMEKVALAGRALTLSRDNGRIRGGIRHMSRAVVDAKLNDLPILLTQARAIPHQTNGKPDGFLIQEIAPGSLYDQAGLKNNDIIRRVNGQPVTRPEQGIKLFQSLRNANGIDLEIARGGAVHTVHFDIR